MWTVYAEPSHAAMHGRAIDSEPPGGFGYIALAGHKHCPEVGLMAVVAEARRHARQLVRQVRHLDKTFITERRGKGDGIVQLADIARPGIVEDQQSGSAGEPERPALRAALLRNSGLRRDAPFPLQLQAARMISAVPRAEKRFMRATRI
jgi:hypothetical protein